MLMLSPQVRQVTQLVRIHSHLWLIFQLYGLGHLASPNSELTSETTDLSSQILAHLVGQSQQPTQQNTSTKDNADMYMSRVRFQIAILVTERS
jgi:hypothetical protein